MGSSSDRPLISYIMPNYNCGPWILQAIQSVLGQTYQPIELAICDNGSTDDSRKIIENFKDDPRIKWVFESEPLGHSKPVNLALSLTRGKYVIKLDSDDFQENWHAEKLMSLAAQNPDIDIIYADIDDVDVSGRWKAHQNATQQIERIFDICCISHNGSLVKRSVYDELGGYDEQLQSSPDWEFLIRAAKAGKKFLYAGQGGHKWRRRPGAATSIWKVGSNVRRESHSYIRKKHNLKGPCKCGCGAVA